jgi:hypothetical protein
VLECGVLNALSLSITPDGKYGFWEMMSLRGHWGEVGEVDIERDDVNP